MDDSESIPQAAFWKIDIRSTGTVAILELDFSLDPAWFNSTDEIKTLVISSPGINNAKLQSIMFTDKNPAVASSED